MVSRPDAVKRFGYIWAISIAIKIAALGVFAFLVLYVFGVHP